MLVRELRHDRPSGWFSKSRGLSASISFISSPPLLAPLFVPFFTWSLTLVPRSLFLNHTETLATQARVREIAAGVNPATPVYGDRPGSKLV